MSTGSWYGMNLRKHVKEFVEMLGLHVEKVVGIFLSRVRVTASACQTSIRWVNGITRDKTKAREGLPQTYPPCSFNILLKLSSSGYLVVPRNNYK